MNEIKCLQLLKRLKNNHQKEEQEQHHAGTSKSGHLYLCCVCYNQTQSLTPTSNSGKESFPINRKKPRAGLRSILIAIDVQYDVYRDKCRI